MSAYNIRSDEEIQQLIDDLKNEINRLNEVNKTLQFNIIFYRTKINKLLTVIAGCLVVVLVVLSY